MGKLGALCRTTMVVVVLQCTVLLPAQQEPPPQQPQPPLPAQPNPAPPPAERAPEPPFDPARAAAEILRRRLGLDATPAGPVPSGPPSPPPRAATEAAPAERDAEPNTEQEPPAEGATPQEPAPQDPVPAPPRPAPDAAQAPPFDPAEQAARALRQRLLPNATAPALDPERATPIEPSAAAPAPIPDAAAALASAVPIHGVLQTRYRYRDGAGTDDQDLVTRLGVDVGSPSDDWSLHLRGRAFGNLDGGRGDDAFGGLDHSFGDDLHARLYALHLDLRQVPGLALLRAGRQDLDETPVVLSFDGVRADSVPFGGALRAFVHAHAGVPVHHFESSRRGDAVVGFGVGLVPWHGGRLRFDWQHLRDEFLSLDRRDDLIAVRAFQNLGDVVLTGFQSWRDGEPRDLSLTAAAPIGELADVRLAYRALLTTQRAAVTELDPFTAIAGAQVPFRQFEFGASRAVGRHLVFGGGVDVRRLVDARDEGAFNREFERLHADVTVQDLWVEGLAATLIGNVFEASGETYRAATGELVYRPDPSLRVVAGCGYDLFRYDAFDDRERLDVWSQYVRFEHRPDPNFLFEIGYERQQDDFDVFQLLRVGMTWTF